MAAEACRALIWLQIILVNIIDRLTASVFALRGKNLDEVTRRPGSLGAISCVPVEKLDALGQLVFIPASSYKALTFLNREEEKG